MKIDRKTIKEVCAQHKVDHVVVTEDGSIFLPNAISHAKEHARQTGTKIKHIDSLGDDVVQEEKVQSPLPNLNKQRPEPTLKQMNNAQLLTIVAELIEAKKIKAPDNGLTNKQLVEWIETSRKAEKSEEPPVVGTPEEGSQETPQTKYSWVK